MIPGPALVHPDLVHPVFTAAVASEPAQHADDAAENGDPAID